MNIYLLALLIALPILGVLYITGYLQKALRYVYGDFTKNELNKFLLYGLLFFCIIGVYWLLRCVKDSIFTSFLGAKWIAVAKIVSLAVVFPIVMAYSYLVDRFPRQHLFYVLSVIYAALFLGLSFLINSSSFGLYAPIADRFQWLGWISYVAVESFGSLFPVLFYSFMADTTTPESGKKGFFITATFAQVGAIFGSLLVSEGACRFGVPNLVAVAGMIILILIPAIVSFMMWAIPKSEFIGYQAKGDGKHADAANKKPKPGFVEGIRLILTQPFLLGIFVIVWSFEAVVTVFDLQFKVLIEEFAKGDPSIFAQYAGGFGVWVSALALASLLLGIGRIGRKIGLTMSLALMPVLMIANIVFMAISPVLSIVFWVMVASKGINYSLGQPSKEQLFIPTSRDAKYKSKTWIDMFGSRFSKASGSMVMIAQTALGATAYFAMGSSLAICITWLFVAMFVGKKHKAAVDANEVVC